MGSADLVRFLWPQREFTITSVMGGMSGNAAWPGAVNSLPLLFTVLLYSIKYGPAHDTHSALEI